jgi:hypothetical protein
MKRWWHYTLACKFVHIVANGGLRRSSVGVPRGERRVVWFTSRANWETTVSPMFEKDGARHWCSRDQLLELWSPLIRIEVPDDVARHPWGHFRQHSGIHPRAADRLEVSAAERDSNPLDWRVSYHDVPIAKWLNVEASDDGDTWMLVGNSSGIDEAFLSRLQDSVARQEDA